MFTLLLSYCYLLCPISDNACHTLWIHQISEDIKGFDLDLLLFYVAFNSQGHIEMGSLWVEEPVHTSKPPGITLTATPPSPPVDIRSHLYLLWVLYPNEIN